MIIYVLSGVTSGSPSYNTTVLGVYTSPSEMIKALDTWHKGPMFLSHYFYDVRDTDQPAEWTNEQMAIYPGRIEQSN